MTQQHRGMTPEWKLVLTPENGKTVAEALNKILGGVTYTLVVVPHQIYRWEMYENQRVQLEHKVEFVPKQGEEGRYLLIFPCYQTLNHEPGRLTYHYVRDQWIEVTRTPVEIRVWGNRLVFQFQVEGETRYWFIYLHR